MALQMAHQTITKKIPGGKLVRLKAALVNGRLVKPQLSGDFFVMPSEKLVLLETVLDGYEVEHLTDLQKKLDQIIESSHMQIAGFGTADIVEMVKQLAGQGFR